ncbi:hypothetical protein LTR08_000857 [Meristemomyces frigidus]|nr:hypothetical protein LTR08_000857 [Meristemomyces frigidus]
MAPHGSAFPSELPSRSPNQSFKERHCPNMRGCWSFSFAAFSLKTTEKAQFARRVCMILTLAERTALSVLSIIHRGYGGLLTTVIIGSIVAVIGFFFIAWCLATIGEARGVRKVMSVYLGRWHFDAFLAAMAVVHTAILVGWFFGFRGIESSVVWLVLWLLIFAAAWIASWSPEIMETPPRTAGIGKLKSERT